MYSQQFAEIMNQTCDDVTPFVNQSSGQWVMDANGLTVDSPCENISHVKTEVAWVRWKFSSLPSI